MTVYILVTEVLFLIKLDLFYRQPQKSKRWSWLFDWDGPNYSRKAVTLPKSTMYIIEIELKVKQHNMTITSEKLLAFDLKSGIENIIKSFHICLKIEWW